MVSINKILQLRPTPRHVADTHTPVSVHLFASSSSSSSSSLDSNSNPTSEPPPKSQSQYQSALRRLLQKDELIQPPQQRGPQWQQPPRMAPPVGPSPPVRVLKPLKKKLAEYCRRVPSPNSATSSLPEPFSLGNMYNREASRGEDPATDEPQLNPPFLQEIRASFSNMAPKKDQNEKNLGPNESMPPSYTSDQYTKQSSTVIRGSDSLPTSVFGPEEDGDGSAEETNSVFVKLYSRMELGEKPRSPLPEKKGNNKDGFLLEELNQRLVKLREMEEMEVRRRIQARIEERIGVRKHVAVISSNKSWYLLVKMKPDDTTKKRQELKFDALDLSGTTPDYVLLPAKDDGHLYDVFKYETTSEYTVDPPEEDDFLEETFISTLTKIGELKLFKEEEKASG